MDSVIITGATGYFGRYFVKHLSEHYNVIASSRSIEKLNALFPTDKVIKWQVDLNNIEEHRNELRDLCAKNRVIGLVNNGFDLSPNTGFNDEGGRINNMSPDMLRGAFESGVVAPFVLSQEVAKVMIEKGIEGRIVNISSMYALVSPSPKLYEGKDSFNPISYGIAKAGLDAMTRYMASFWGEYGICVNSIAPGPFPNVETQSANATRDEEFIQRLRDRTCKKEVGHPKELLGMLDLLLSPKSSFVTGQTISVDGGWTKI
jgi:gluconate 5-dehydrogenase